MLAVLLLITSNNYYYYIQDVSDPRQLLSKSNINQTALEQYSKEAAMYSTNGALQNLQFATNHRGNHDVAIFDFTSLFASEHASMILERKGKRMLLCVAGDTLLEVLSLLSLIIMFIQILY